MGRPPTARKSSGSARLTRSPPQRLSSALRSVSHSGPPGCPGPPRPRGSPLLTAADQGCPRALVALDNTGGVILGAHVLNNTNMKVVAATVARGARPSVTSGPHASQRGFVSRRDLTRNLVELDADACMMYSTVAPSDRPTTLLWRLRRCPSPGVPSMVRTSCSQGRFWSRRRRCTYAATSAAWCGSPARTRHEQHRAGLPALRRPVCQ